MNVKQGDLAIVISATMKQNIGIICKVEEWIGTRHLHRACVHNAWRVTSNGRPFIFPETPPNITAGVTDRALRRVSGLDDPIDIDVSVPLQLGMD